MSLRIMYVYIAAANTQKVINWYILPTWYEIASLGIPVLKREDNKDENAIWPRDEPTSSLLGM